MFIGTLEGTKFLFLDKGSAIKFRSANDNSIIQDADNHLIIEKKKKKEEKEYATALN